MRAPFVDRLAELLGERPEAGAPRSATPRGQRLLGLLVWALLVLAMARPVWLEDPVTRTRPSRPVQIFPVTRARHAWVQN